MLCKEEGREGVGRASRKEGVGWWKIEICSVKRMTVDERLLPDDTGSELADCRGMFGVIVFRNFSGNSQKNRFIFSFLHITCIEQCGDMRASGPPEI